MSRENVEIVRRGYDYFRSTGEPASHEMSPDFVWDMSTFAGWPEKQVYEGPDGAREFLTAWVSAWEDWELESIELIDAGERVVAIQRQRGKAKESGITVDMVFAQVWTARDGRLVRMEMYADPAEALEAVGHEPSKAEEQERPPAR
jgi:ketosteroid isomerase-like protein